MSASADDDDRTLWIMARNLSRNAPWSSQGRVVQLNGWPIGFMDSTELAEIVVAAVARDATAIDGLLRNIEELEAKVAHLDQMLDDSRLRSGCPAVITTTEGVSRYYRCHWKKGHYGDHDVTLPTGATLRWSS